MLILAFHVGPETTLIRPSLNMSGTINFVSLGKCVRQYDAPNPNSTEVIVDLDQGSVKLPPIYVVLRISRSTSLTNNFFRIFGNNGAEDQLINNLDDSYRRIFRYRELAANDVPQPLSNKGGSHES